MKTKINYTDFDKLDLRVAKVIQVEIVEGADKLLKLTLDVGELGERIIASGIRDFYQPEELEEKLIVYLANLEPKIIRGIESQGMLLAAGEENPVVLITDKKVKPGEIIG